VVSWAGTRGVVPLAAALSIPLTSASGAPLPRRDLILVLATAVIVVSLIGLYDDGTISQATRQRLQRGLDLAAARLSDDQH